MNWLAWVLFGMLIVAGWVITMTLVAFTFREPPLVTISAVFGAIACAWLGIGITAAFGVTPRIVWGSS
jgi:hypothetical protein